MSDTETVGLDRICETMREPIERFASLTKEIAGDSLKSLTMFGRITTPAFDVKQDVARSVMVVERVDLGVLHRLSEHGLRFGKSHIAAPIIMTPGYIKESLDTFALELIEIMQRHVTVFGEDLFADLSFDDTHVRLQCERELKTVLMGLRQGLLASAGREKYLGALEQDIGDGLLRTIRGMLWLKGTRHAMPAEQVLREIEKMLERTFNGVRTALDRSARHGWTEFVTLYEDVESLESATNAG